MKQEEAGGLERSLDTQDVPALSALNHVTQVPLSRVVPLPAAGLGCGGALVGSAMLALVAYEGLDIAADYAVAAVGVTVVVSTLGYAAYSIASNLVEQAKVQYVMRNPSQIE